MFVMFVPEVLRPNKRDIREIERSETSSDRIAVALEGRVEMDEQEIEKGEREIDVKGKGW